MAGAPTGQIRPSDDAGAAIAVSGATYAYDTHRALDRVDLQIAAGEAVAVVGPNGAGKTTLLRLILGRVAPNAGTVRVFGADPRIDPAVRARLGFVPQQVGLYAHLTTRENLDVFGRLAGLAPRSIPAAVDRALELTALAARANDRLGTLSGGFQRRANIAAAIVHAPRLLVLDEPTVGVDLEAELAIHATLKRLHRDGVTLLLVTHDLEHAAALVDRVVFMLAGRPVLDGAPAELLDRCFADRKELIVELVDPRVDAPTRAALEAEGFTPGERPNLWVAQTRHGYADVTERAERLERSGLGVKEIRVRQPGLESLMLQLGRETSTER